MRFGPLLILVGIVALAQHESRLERADTLAVVYVFCTAAGLALSFRRYSVLRWLAASLPFSSRCATLPKIRKKAPSSSQSMLLNPSPAASPKSSACRR